MMTTRIAILPVPVGDGPRVAHHATTGNQHSHGATAGQALDALAAQLALARSGGATPG